MDETRVLITAAGTGSRAGLPYPKALFPLQGKPILIWIHDLLAAVDASPTVIVSPSGEAAIAECLVEHEREAHRVVQPTPRGMGDAVLHFRASPAYPSARNVLLVWGDIPFIQPQTVQTMLSRHYEADNHFTFATRHVDSAYTVVERDAAGGVLRVSETRERGNARPTAGEREIGLFVFRTDSVLDLLQTELPGKYGSSTGEHGFLYLIEHLVAEGLRVEGLPIATELDIVSLNSIRDVEAFL